MALTNDSIYQSAIGDIIQTFGQHLYSIITKHVPASNDRQLALTTIEQGVILATKAVEVAFPGPIAIAAEVAGDAVQAAEPIQTVTK